MQLRDILVEKDALRDYRYEAKRDSMVNMNPARNMTAYHTAKR